MNSQRSQILQKRIQELIWYVARTGTTEIFSGYMLASKYRELIDSNYQLMQDYKPFIIREAEKINKINRCYLAEFKRKRNEL